MLVVGLCAESVVSVGAECAAASSLVDCVMASGVDALVCGCE